MPSRASPTRKGKSTCAVHHHHHHQRTPIVLYPSPRSHSLADLRPRSVNDNDIAQWAPNPFLGFNPGSNPSATASQLSLVDGGEDLQNIPFNPLVQPERAVDVVFAVDSSADTTFNWPNGTALRASYDRTMAAIANGTLFPPVPDADTFVNLGLNARPSFFGCDAANFSSTAGGTVSVPPLVVYLPNAPYTTFSNVTTFEPTYPTAQRDAMVANGLEGATQGNASLDAQWPACLACAALSRSLARTRTAVPAGCTACFARYCWNGTLDAAASSSPYEPALKLPGSASSSSSSSGSGGSKSAGARVVDARALGVVKVGVALCAGAGALALLGL